MALNDPVVLRTGVAAHGGEGCGLAVVLLGSPNYGARPEGRRAAAGHGVLVVVVDEHGNVRNSAGEAHLTRRCGSLEAFGSSIQNDPVGVSVASDLEQINDLLVDADRQLEPVENAGAIRLGIHYKRGRHGELATGPPSKP